MQRDISTFHRHTQTAESALWTITHNLGRYPVVDVFVSIDGQLRRIMPSEVTFIDNNMCTVAFSSPRSGFATVV